MGEPSSALLLTIALSLVVLTFIFRRNLFNIGQRLRRASSTGSWSVKVVLREGHSIRFTLRDEGRRGRKDGCLVEVFEGFGNGFDFLLSLLVAVSRWLAEEQRKNLPCSQGT